MTSNSNILINESLSFLASYDQSKIDISNSGIEEKSEPSNYNGYIKEISKSFVKIKDLKENFNLDSYEKLTNKMRNYIRKIRKAYYGLEKDECQTTKDKNKKQIQSISNNPQPSSTNHSNTGTKAQSNRENNTNSNSNLKQEKVNKINFSQLNDTTFIEGNMISNNFNNITIKEIYDILLEISSYLLCYDDIYINYKNKSAFLTLKLFLQFSSLLFIQKIGKEDFLIMMMNKICNILCKYNYLQKDTDSIKKLLNLTEKDVNKIKVLYNSNINNIKDILKKLKKEIDKINLIYKSEKIDEENILNNLSNDTEVKKNLDFNENDIIIKFNKLKQENEILEKIQNNLDENYKMYLKEPIKNELEIFNLLMNDLSKYKAPLIKKKFLEIILRNKDVFNYINENIFFDKIPDVVIRNYNLYPFNKNLSIYIDKYIETGKIIIDHLGIPLEQDYLNIFKDLEIFSKIFLEKLFENCKLKCNFEINYYYLTLFAYMINSHLQKKEDYFNRIGASVDSNSDSDFSDIYCVLKDTEDISYSYLNKENGDTILFDFKNINNNIISFFLEKKGDGKKENKNKKEENKENSLTNLEICSILAKKMFELDSLNIILTIALKYWATQRNIFKYNYIESKNENLILDDPILIYLIFYFFIHKGKIGCFDLILENKKKEQKKKKNNNENKDKKINNEKQNIINEKANIINEKKELLEEKQIKTKEQKNIKIEKKEENKKDKLSIKLKTLGELFIEFFWFIHELTKLALEESKQGQIVNISLSTKKYMLKNSEEKDTVLKLIISDISIYELDTKKAMILKSEATRALYYLLSKNEEGLFAFDKHIPSKKFKY